MKEASEKHASETKELKEEFARNINDVQTKLAEEEERFAALQVRFQVTLVACIQRRATDSTRVYVYVLSKLCNQPTNHHIDWFCTCVLETVL